MKATLKSIGTTTLLLLLAVTMNAQFSIGVKGGANFANITTGKTTQSILPNFNNNNGFTVGAVAEYSFSDAFALQSELNFTQKGFAFKADKDINVFNLPVPVGVKATTELNYLEMPILAKVKFGNGIVGGYVAAGPTLGYATGGNFKTAANFIVDFNLTNTSLNLDALNVSRFEVAGTIGAGATVNVGGPQLFVDARYNHGFSKLDNLPIVDINFKNKSVGLTAGILIPMGKGRAL